MMRAASFTLCLLALCSLGAAGAAEPAPDAAAAAAAYEAKDWEAAARAYRVIVEAEPKNTMAWFRLGVSHLEADRPAQALDALAKAAALNPGMGISALFAARATAALKQPEAAFDWLTKAARSGTFTRADLADDPQLATLRADSRWPQVLDTAAKANAPCAHTKAYQALQFWVGEWDVHMPNGVVVGQSTVTAEVGRCVLRERWVGGLGTEGASQTYYDPRAQTWHQTYLDSKGGISIYVGRKQGESVVFEGTLRMLHLPERTMRMTFSPLPEGQVRQLIERRGPDGEWAVDFDGRYVPRDPAPPTP